MQKTINNDLPVKVWHQFSMREGGIGSQEERLSPLEVEWEESQIGVKSG